MIKALKKIEWKLEHWLFIHLFMLSQNHFEVFTNLRPKTFSQKCWAKTILWSFLLIFIQNMLCNVLVEML